MKPKYPKIKVNLSGQDGNAFVVLGQCLRAARDAGLPQEQIEAFRSEATTGNYDHLLRTAILWFTCK